MRVLGLISLLTPLMSWVAGDGSHQHAFKSSIDDNYFNVSNAGMNWDGNVVHDKSYPDYALRVKSPKLCDKVKQYSGYLDITSNNHFFYWFFESRSNPSKDPLILWLNGGPGCSSMTGLLMELGPCRVNKGGKNATHNPYSWNQHANIIFLDQPINVGFSYGSKRTTNTRAAGKDVYAFLQLFFKKFPHLRQSEFHLFGESYGGHYVPGFADIIVKKNLRSPSSAKINLKSIGVGNGLTDPLTQYKYYPEMACHNSYKPVLSNQQCQRMTQQFPKCEKLIQECYNTKFPRACQDAFNKCNEIMLGPYTRTGLNPYDVRKKCGGYPSCYEIIDDVEVYLNNQRVQKELGVHRRFEGCSGAVYNQFYMTGDWMYPLVKKIPKLLSADIKVLIYAGDADFICNWIGNKAWVVNLNWNHGTQFRNATDRPWTPIKGMKTMGEVRKAKNLTFLRIFGGGHMVPYDQPKASLAMINSWIGVSTTTQL